MIVIRVIAGMIAEGALPNAAIPVMASIWEL
jgi:hypothetical protein